jgi:hypothetical protein
MSSGTAPSTKPEAFPGLIQHSFALRMGDAHHPFDGSSVRECIAERFELRTATGKEFRVKPLRNISDSDRDNWAARHSPLVQAEMTTVRSRALTLLDEEGRSGGEDDRQWPAALAWARGEQANGHCRTAARPRMRFAEFDQRYERVSENDFLVEASKAGGDESQRCRVARALLESIAFRRSQLFGLAVANRFVNVMLPSATLEYQAEKGPGKEGTDEADRDLILQPLVSLTRDGGERRMFRKTYSLTFFLIPVRDAWRQREISKCEIESIVNAGWSLSDSAPEKEVSSYVMSWPLGDYLTDLSRPEMQALLEVGEDRRPLSLRQTVEIVAFGIALRMTQGSSGEALSTTKCRIGDDVVTSLGTARVSAAVLVDPNLEVADIKTPIKRREPPGSLKELMSTLACETREPSPWTSKTRRQYTLDRPFVDGPDYAVGVIPRNRCLVVTNVARDEGSQESLLSQVAAVTYMTIGAATAIGTMRTIGHELERMERKDPVMIAEIDGEIATDLNEIYDLDITRESYRHLYRRLRRQLGIARDYKTLQGKMEALYRETSTIHDDREQKQLAVLTAAIVILSVLILIGTVVIAAKPV